MRARKRDGFGDGRPLPDRVQRCGMSLGSGPVPNAAHCSGQTHQQLRHGRKRMRLASRQSSRRPGGTHVALGSPRQRLATGDDESRAAVQHRRSTAAEMARRNCCRCPAPWVASTWALPRAGATFHRVAPARSGRRSLTAPSRAGSDRCRWEPISQPAQGPRRRTRSLPQPCPGRPSHARSFPRWTARTPCGLCPHRRRLGWWPP